MSPYRSPNEFTVEFETAKLARQFDVTIEHVDPDRLQSTAAKELAQYAYNNRQALGLVQELTIYVSGFHSVFKRTPHGLYLVEVIVQFVQTDEQPGFDLGGLPLRGGTTIIAGADGTVRYVISKPIPCVSLADDFRDRADSRLKHMTSFMRLCDARDPRVAWGDDKYLAERMKLRASFKALHSG